jgi:hypothetical protein
MKQLISTTIFLLFCLVATQAQVQKNIVKSYQHDGAKLVTLAVEGEVEIEEWDEEIVRLVTSIDAVNFNAATLKALTEAGRYTASSKNVDGNFILTMLKAQKELILRGIKIEEKYRFKIFVPRGTTVEQVTYADVAELF